jgi:hypothetical protein
MKKAFDCRRHPITSYLCPPAINKEIQMLLTRRTKLRKEAAIAGLGWRSYAVCRAFASNADGVIKPIIDKDKSGKAVR